MLIEWKTRLEIGRHASGGTYLPRISGLEFAKPDPWTR
jgi:hypothetical protein